jgi:hypothetical protein
MSSSPSAPHYTPSRDSIGPPLARPPSHPSTDAPGEGPTLPLARPSRRRARAASLGLPVRFWQWPQRNTLI